jgi:hypothetical protein
MFRYRCADFLYLVVEDGIFAEAEIPAGWGLLIRVTTEAGDELRMARAPANLDAAPGQRSALLEMIALAGTRAVNRAAGIAPPSLWSMMTGGQNTPIDPPEDAEKQRAAGL